MSLGRYFPCEHHAELSNDFKHELDAYGHIYMYRFRPTYIPLKVTTFTSPRPHTSRALLDSPAVVQAYPVDQFPSSALPECRALMHMILNNLDPAVAQYPHELVTYGGNGQVFSNWAQLLLVLGYLGGMQGNQTLVLYSGHPLGLFPSHAAAPRVVLTNGIVIPNYSSQLMYDKLFALGQSSSILPGRNAFCIPKLSRNKNVNLAVSAPTGF